MGEKKAPFAGGPFIGFDMVYWSFIGISVK
jgi:hypothetical protein